jgi:hypothetical protein
VPICSHCLNIYSAVLVDSVSEQDMPYNKLYIVSCVPRFMLSKNVVLKSDWILARWTSFFSWKLSWYIYMALKLIWVYFISIRFYFIWFYNNCFVICANTCHLVFMELGIYSELYKWFNTILAPLALHVDFPVLQLTKSYPVSVCCLIKMACTLLPPFRKVKRNAVLSMHLDNHAF